jgi:hypothetical protein
MKNNLAKIIQNMFVGNIPSSSAKAARKLGINKTMNTNVQIKSVRILILFIFITL